MRLNAGLASLLLSYARSILVLCLVTVSDLTVTG